MRPILRPGLHVLRRDLRTLQLGLEWPGKATVLETPGVRAVLDAVDGYRDLEGVVLAAAAAGVSASGAAQAVALLVDAGVLVEQRPGLPGDVDRGLCAALWLLSGPTGSAEELLSSRRAERVHVEGTGRVARLLRALVVEEKVPLTDDPTTATLVAIAADGELPRSRSDEAMRRGVPYLCVSIRELVGLVGPFVVPGRTACLRCVDLARSQRDRSWPTLVESACAKPEHPAGCSPALAATTAGYAAAEVALWASGSLPVSCDRVVEIPYGIGTVQNVSYPPHPECGCGWAESHDTMSA